MANADLVKSLTDVTAPADSVADADLDRMMVYTATSNIELRLERLGQIPGVRAILCLDESTGGVMHKTQELSEVEAAAYAVTLLDLCRRVRLTIAALMAADEAPVTLAVRTRHTEYLLCPDHSSSCCLVIIQHIRPDADEENVHVRLLKLWDQDLPLDWPVMF